MQGLSNLYRTNTSFVNDAFPGVASRALTHPSAMVAASLFGNPSVAATSVGTDYSFPSLMAAVASTGAGNGEMSALGSTLGTNGSSCQPVPPITPVPFRLGEFPFPGGLAAFRKLQNLIRSNHRNILSI